MSYKNNNKNNKFKKYFKKFIVQVLICSLIVIITLIVSKKYNKVRAFIKENIYETSFNFAYVNDLYTKYLGDKFPLFNNFFEEKTVFNEKLKYSKDEKYYDGVYLSVDNNYLVPIIEDGIVVFVGEKEYYGNIVIIQSSKGIDYWYGNIDNINVKLYDYVEKGNLLGEVKDNKLYMVFQKDGKYLDYKNYIN